MSKTYVRTSRKSKDGVKGQAKLVLDALDMRGEGTVEELTGDIKELGLVTRQAPERITSYYLCIFKKQGLVTVRETPDPVEDAGAKVEVEELEG
jgi:hypothetical protein